MDIEIGLDKVEYTLPDAELLASPSNRRMPEPNIGDRNSYGSCVHEFRTAKLRRGFRVFAQDQVRRGWSKIIAIIQWVLIFEQSVNRRRGPRWWPQIGAAATIADRFV